MSSPWQQFSKLPIYMCTEDQTESLGFKTYIRHTHVCVYGADEDFCRLGLALTGLENRLTADEL